MINLNETPEAVLTMDVHDRCTLDGRELICDHMSTQARIVLTTADSDFVNGATSASHEEYDVYFRHVRTGELGFAICNRDLLLSYLLAGEYTIS